jgi:hypothetical protein
MDVFAKISETANTIFANSAANIAQAQMGLVVALFIASLVMMLIGWRFGSTRLLVAGGTLIITATGVILFGQNIQDIGTRVISFAVGLGLRAAGNSQSPDAFASNFATFYQPGMVHFDNMMAMADEACGIIGWMCGWWQPTYAAFAVTGWLAWAVTTIGAIMFWISIFSFKLGVIGALVLSAFIVWKLSRHIATAPLFFCVKAAIYTFCITFMLTAGNMIMLSVTLVEEPAFYHALPLLVTTAAYAVLLFYSSKLALAIGAGVVSTASSMAAPALMMISMARAAGTGGFGGAVASVFSAAAGGGSGGGGGASPTGGNFRPNRAVAVMNAVRSFGSGGGGGGPVQPTNMPSPPSNGPGPAGGGTPTAAQQRSVRVGAGRKVPVQRKSDEW